MLWKEGVGVVQGGVRLGVGVEAGVVAGVLPPQRSGRATACQQVVWVEGCGIRHQVAWL